MKLNTLALCTAFTILLSTPITSMAGSEFDKASKEATAAINKAKAANYEWRDSRKILKKAAKAEKAGKHAEAMKLAKKAKQQGIIAVAQAKQQKNAGPH